VENIYGKIKTLDELKNIAAKLKKGKKTIVHCHGVFDLIHPGHIRHLAAAKKEGDVLVVTVTADEHVRKGPGRPVFNDNLRAETLAAMSSVDYVAVNHAPTAVNCIKLLKPDVYVKGQDYRNKANDVTGKISDEELAVSASGGRIHFTDEIVFSSSKLINQHLQVFPEETRKYLKEFSCVHPLPAIFDVIDSLKNLKVLVIGEAIIDQYHYCQPMDKSRKSNVIVYKYVSEESFAGGSLAVANHIAGVAENVTLMTVTGKDDFSGFLSEKMRPNVTMIGYERTDAPTLVKRRFIESNQKLFEVCFMDDSPLPESLEKTINARLKEIIPGFDLVVVSDFGHGFLNQKLISTICRHAKFLAVNTQTNGANMGFNLITQYSNIDYSAIDELELRYAAHDKNGNLETITKDIATKIGCDTVIITRGWHGALSYSKKNGFISSPALATSVVDPIGAGDAFFAFTASLLAKRVPQDLAVFIGNAVGALAVQIVCNREPVDPVYLKKFITSLLK
jgi:rfaE bifunctional protein kinase chain/domain/rfaE bifunctional protein nucleotidyltransferase chain/domain